MTFSRSCWRSEAGNVRISIFLIGNSQVLEQDTLICWREAEKKQISIFLAGFLVKDFLKVTFSSACSRQGQWTSIFLIGRSQVLLTWTCAHLCWRNDWISIF